MEGRGRGAPGPPISKDNFTRLSALAVSLREEFLGNGVPAEELLSCSLSFREDHLPSFPVIRSGAWARLSPAALTEAVLSVMRDGRKPLFDGLRNAMVKGSYHYKLASDS